MAERFRITCRCRVCGFVWKRITSRPDSPDPPCPRPLAWDGEGNVTKTCACVSPPMGMDVTLGIAPAQVGQNTGVKAIDETAKIVMEDHGMTDIRTDVRPGETATPKLPPRQQAMADAMFAPRRRPTNNVHGFNPARAVRAAMTGQLRDPRAVQPIKDLHESHTPGEAPVVAHIIASDRMGRR